VQYHADGTEEVAKEDADYGLLVEKASCDERAADVTGSGVDVIGAPEGCV
jgi:hypothetical protein